MSTDTAPIRREARRDAKADLAPPKVSFKAGRPVWKRPWVWLLAAVVITFALTNIAGGGDDLPATTDVGSAAFTKQSSGDQSGSTVGEPSSSTKGDQSNSIKGDHPGSTEGDQSGSAQPAEKQTAAADPPPKTESEPALTAGQRKAAQSAADYLEFSSFSQSGLIEQLEFEGYSNADATYGVDSLNADWNEQAAESARDYVEASSFYPSGLVEQLMFEGFTSEQAKYGLEKAGF